MKLFVLREEEAPPYDVSAEREALAASAESQLQQRGYIRVHREVLDQSGAMPALLYGIIENFIQIGDQTGMGCVPSHKALAKSLGASVAAVKVYLNTLREAGWLTWEGTDKGGVNRYRLPIKEIARIQPPPSQNLSTPQPESSYKLERTSKQRELTTPPLPPGGERVTPYALFVAVCEEAQLDVGGYSERDKGRHLAVAKRLVGDGVSESEARGVTRWLKSQQWRTVPVTMFTVEKELGNWRAAGKPQREREKKSGYVSQAEMNRGGTGQVVL